MSASTRSRTLSGAESKMMSNDTAVSVSVLRSSSSGNSTLIWNDSTRSWSIAVSATCHRRAVGALDFRSVVFVAVITPRESQLSEHPIENPRGANSLRDTWPETQSTRIACLSFQIKVEFPLLELRSTLTLTAVSLLIILLSAPESGP